MKLHTIISDGQSGADLTGLEIALALGFRTGGTAPKGWRTEHGMNLNLRDLYNLVESPYGTYPPRTRANVEAAPITLWFGNTDSAGYKCTKRACDDLNRPLFVNPTPSVVLRLAHLYEVLNIAGNRASTNPQVCQMVRDAFQGVRDEQKDRL